MSRLWSRNSTRNREIDCRSKFCAICAGENVSHHILGCEFPPKTEPQKFFEFLQQQGYLRVWLDNEIVRVDEDPKKIKRLGARVQVIQDRIAITTENRARLIEAIETALRFGKGKINVVAISKQATGNKEENPSAFKSDIRNPFSTGWHCAHCDSISVRRRRAFQFQ